MKIVKKSNQINKYCINNHQKIGFVPTLGSLHKGHISIIKKAKKENKKCIVSIFLNPKQFNKKKDLLSYPNNIKRDIKLCKKNDVDILFTPNYQQVYRWKNKKSKFPIIKNIMEQKYRKGHFTGVIKVMEKLLNIIKCHRIYLGEKDFQQLVIIKNFININKFKTKIVNCKTIRNKNMLAYSSRNELLSNSDIIEAGSISNFIIKLKKKNKKYNLVRKKIISYLKSKKIKYDYIENFNITNFKTTNTLNKKSRIFIAFYINKIRLIDNY